jgi:SLT domain-containing protein
MQVIRGTFQAYAGRFRGTGPFEYGVSVNPLANVYAAIKYAQANYGPGLRNAYGGIGSGHGYALGTASASAGWAWVGERGPELVRFRGGEQVRPAGGGNTYNITVNVPPTASKADTGRVIVEHIREYERGSGPRWRK